MEDKKYAFALVDDRGNGIEFETWEDGLNYLNDIKELAEKELQKIKSTLFVDFEK